MKKMNLFTLLLCAFMFACNNAEETTEEVVATETDTEQMEEVEEVPTVENTEMNVEYTSDGAPVTINNPYSSTGVGFCVKQIFVDEKEVDTEVNTEVIAFDLTDMEMEDGQVFNLRIVHEENCMPEVVMDEPSEE